MFNWALSVTSFWGIVLLWWGFMSFARWLYEASRRSDGSDPSDSGTFKSLVALAAVVALLSSYVLLVRGGAKSLFEMEPGEELYHP
jgi:hypothetical protein